MSTSEQWQKSQGQHESLHLAAQVYQESRGHEKFDDAGRLASRLQAVHWMEHFTSKFTSQGANVPRVNFSLHQAFNTSHILYIGTKVCRSVNEDYFEWHKHARKASNRPNQNNAWQSKTLHLLLSSQNWSLKNASKESVHGLTGLNLEFQN